MRFFKNIYLTGILAFLYLPIFVLVIYSFNNAKYSMLLHGFSLQWYQTLFTDTDLIRTAWHSIVLGISSATLTCILSILITTAILRYKFRSRKILHNLLLILIITPDLVLGIILLILFSAMKVPLGFTSLLLAHITFCLPFATLTIYSQAVDLDINIFESAQDLGASDAKIFFKILLPLIKPAIVAAWLLAFAISLDDVIVSFFVSGPSFSILPLKLYSMTRVGITPEINAAGSILICLTLILILLYQLTQRKTNA